MKKLYEVTGVDRREFNLEVTCSYPFSFDHGIAKYIVVPVSDYIAMESMFDV